MGEMTLPHGGGRVNELMARPLLNLFYPELAGFLQPLAGEIAARRDLLERLPFATGYAIEIAHLIDAYRAVGLAGMAQVDLDVRQNRHQDLDALAPMAFAILQAVAARLEREGRLVTELPSLFLAPEAGRLAEREVELVERPPMAELRAAV
jgi:glucosyl-3-phosphoglycerate synthase